MTQHRAEDRTYRLRDETTWSSKLAAAPPPSARQRQQTRTPGQGRTASFQAHRPRGKGGVSNDVWWSPFDPKMKQRAVGRPAIDHQSSKKKETPAGAVAPASSTCATGNELQVQDRTGRVRPFHLSPSSTTAARREQIRQGEFIPMCTHTIRTTCGSTLLRLFSCPQRRPLCGAPASRRARGSAATQGFPATRPPETWPQRAPTSRPPCPPPSGQARPRQRRPWQS